MSKNPDKRQCELREVKLAEAETAFGLAGSPFEVELADLGQEIEEVEVPIDPKLMSERQVNPATVVLFRWEADERRFERVPGSRIGDDWKSVRARFLSPGVVYVPVGRTSNPWARQTLSLLRQFAPVLDDPDLGPLVRDRICPVLLCPGEFSELLDRLGDRAAAPPPLTPGADFCQFCLGSGDPRHLIELDPPGSSGGDIRPGGSCCDLYSLLRYNPNIERNLIWRGPDPVRYQQWSAQQKSDLYEAFAKICSGEIAGLPAEPSLVDDGEGIADELSAEDAWRTYVAHVAHSLVVEACGWVPWSIAGDGFVGRNLLLGSDSLFAPTSSGTYRILYYEHGYGTPGDPTRVYRFLREEGVVAGNRLDTVGRMIEWCRDHLRHFTGPVSRENFIATWDYPGYPPVEKLIADAASAPTVFARTAGCWGTTAFLRLVLRTVNIPVSLLTRCGHAQPCFPSEGRYLDHGDNPYNRNFIDSGASGLDLLIDNATYREWFDSSVASETVCDNVGRRPRELNA